MKRLIVGAALVAALAACAPSQGTVVERRFDPAHDETHWRQQWAGESCSGTGSSRVCTPRYISVPYTVHVEDRWFFRLRDCDGADPSDCSEGEVQVSHEVYEQVANGEFYEVPER